ncbi:MAG: aldo/keto reductase [Formivibrio sp.]|nr:aldo/keto reductase [Formivibrio sp.]
MLLRQLGASGIQASAIAMGTWAIGGGLSWGDNDDDLSVYALHSALDAGVNLIDTAPMYGFGHSEEVVGKAIKGRREHVVLATKCGLLWDREDFGAFYLAREGRRIFRSLHPDVIREELEISLKRLGTDYIDLYQTHWPTLAQDRESISATMECLMQFKMEGKIRAIGASNVNLEQIREYQSHGVLDVVQMRYTMLDRKIEGALLDYCKSQNISVLAYSPLEQGLLTGNVGMDRLFGVGEIRAGKAWFSPLNRKRVLDMLAGWHDLTCKYHCTLSQLVIAWTIAQSGVTHAVCGARKPDQILDNAGAGRLTLDSVDIQRIRLDVDGLGEPLSA